MDEKGKPVICALLTALFPLALLTGCGGGGGGGVAPAAGPPILSATVSAAAGGTFTDNAVAPTFSMTIPPGALSSDANLTVSAVPFPSPVRPNQTAASNAFRHYERRAGIILRRPWNSGWPPSLPVHLNGEIAVLIGGSKAEFRPLRSDSTVVALTVGTSVPSGGSIPAAHDRTAVAASLTCSERDMSELLGPTVGLQLFLTTTPTNALALGVRWISQVPADIVTVMTGRTLQTSLPVQHHPELIKAPS
jgi:hypothetical protein